MEAHIRLTRTHTYQTSFLNYEIRLFPFRCVCIECGAADAGMQFVLQQSAEACIVYRERCSSDQGDPQSPSHHFQCTLFICSEENYSFSQKSPGEPLFLFFTNLIVSREMSVQKSADIKIAEQMKKATALIHGGCICIIHSPISKVCTDINLCEGSPKVLRGRGWGHIFFFLVLVALTTNAILVCARVLKYDFLKEHTAASPFLPCSHHDSYFLSTCYTE